MDVTGKRLTAAEIRQALKPWPADVRRRAFAARDFVLDTMPALDETVAFGALCYFRRGAPYGVIGGNVCLIDCRRGELLLSFLHGAFLDDPSQLLTGRAKAKRSLLIGHVEELKNPAVADLIRAAARYTPGS